MNLESLDPISPTLIQLVLQVRIGLISLLFNGKYVSGLNDDQRVELFIAALPYLFPSTGGMLKILQALLSSDYIHMSPMLEAISGGNTYRFNYILKYNSTGNDFFFVI